MINVQAENNTSIFLPRLQFKKLNCESYIVISRRDQFFQQIILEIEDQFRVRDHC